MTFILLGSALVHYENKEQHNKNNHCALGSYTSGRKHPLYTGEQQRFTKQVSIPNHYICIKISKKSHIVHCKCPYSLHILRYSSHWVCPLAQEEAMMKYF